MESAEFAAKNEALTYIKNHFRDNRKNCIIPFELKKDNKCILNMEDLEKFKKIYTFFQENPCYGKAVSEHEARIMQSQF